MTDLTELRMNVAALKRVDPYVKDILETATHVALYTFNANKNEWEKTDIEGALFVYSRNGEPYHSILIMNRLNTNNLVEPVTQGLDLQLQEPFLLYRNSKGNIYGIWFYEKDECVRIDAMLNKLIKDTDENRKPVNKITKRSLNMENKQSNNVDIFSMLSRAQENFTNKSSANASAELSRSKSMGNNIGEAMHMPLSAPLGPDVTSQSVMDFFAKAKVNTGHLKAEQPNVAAVCVPESKPLLARLMSHPAAHTVENIEKQHRSVTPQPSSHHQETVLTPNIVGSITGTTPNRTKRRSNNQAMTENDTLRGMLNKEVQKMQASQTPIEKNNTSGFHRIQSPSTPVMPNLTNHHRSNNTVATDQANTLASLFRSAITPAGSEEVCASQSLNDSGSAPALMPPVMFAAPRPPEPLNRPIEPLTKNQLSQAFNYLLRNDPDFVNKLHEAYVKSFSEILS